MMKVGSKWKCKVDTCIVKWLLTKHLKNVHGLVIEKAKPKRPSTSKGGPQHQNHCHKPSLGLVTKARACNSASQEGSLGVTFRAPKSVGKCEGMNIHTPK